MPVLVALPGAVVLAASALPASAEPPAGTPDGGTVGAAELLAEVKGCDRISHGMYRTDQGTPANIPVCGTKETVFWKADMDIDCDGRTTAVCNTRTDPSFQAQTAFQTSAGKPLDSSRLPYVVVPGPGPLWKYSASGIEGGALAAVVYQGKVTWAVVGDTGPTGIIGEASYATARELGIDPDPRTGGTASGVTYILFRNSKVSPVEDHAAAVAEGESLARKLVAGS
ncbi:glycoside hydrolase family 75 protein [Streptomyces sp. NPDC102402]|uniref:glycoside hydrolase family 75 protein n=1 Tax=Streptomyces sp. NPDC102402 TaxID=3366169 RepID=UPI0038100435